jgi:hypothetical protein
MQEENKTETISTDLTGGVQEEVASQEVNTNVEEVLPSTEVIDMVPANTAIGS